MARLAIDGTSHALTMVMNAQTKKARIEYTVERRSGAVRKAKEVPADKVEREIEKLVEKSDAFNFEVKYEA